MREKYQNALHQLNAQYHKMLDLSADALYFVNLQTTYCSLSQLELITKQLCALQKEIMYACEMLILKEQPVAQDLEWIMRIMRQILDLRRIGELSLNCARIIATIPKSMQYALLEQMSQLLCEMFAAFRHAQAHRVIELEDTMDMYFRRMKIEMVQNMQDTYKNAHWWCEILMLSKYFEKIADHISAINYAATE